MGKKRKSFISILKTFNFTYSVIFRFRLTWKLPILSAFEYMSAFNQNGETLRHMAMFSKKAKHGVTKTSFSLTRLDRFFSYYNGRRVRYCKSCVDIRHLFWAIEKIWEGRRICPQRACLKPKVMLCTFSSSTYIKQRTFKKVAFASDNYGG